LPIPHKIILSTEKSFKMLEKLNTIDWSKLQHAYGNASDVPELIRALASDDVEKRQKAYGNLNGNIIHQGSIYEAAAYAVPFFIELLQFENVLDKHHTLQLLSSLARGGSWHQSHQHIDWLFRKEGEKPEFQEKVRSEVNHVKASYDAVVSGYETYLALTSHPVSEVRKYAVEALSNCGPFENEIELIIRRLIEEEKDLKLRKPYLLSLKYFWQHPDFHRYTPKLGEEEFQYLLDLFHHSELLILRYASTLALADMADAELAEELFAFFDEIMELPASERAAIGYELHELMQDMRRYHPKLAYAFLKRHLAQPDEEIQFRICYQFEYFGTGFRSYSQEIADLLAPLLKSKSERLSIRAAQTMGVLGQFAKPHLAELEAILGDNTSVGRTGAKRALREVRENNWSLDKHLQATSLLDEPVSQLIQSLDEINALTNFAERLGAAADARKIAYTLEQYGEKAGDAIPTLLQTMRENGIDYVRVHAARAILSIAPIEHYDIVLKSLLKELRPYPTAILVVNTLGLMGADAKPALDLLQKIADSDYRFTKHSLANSVNLDEMFLMELKAAIIAIEAT
jgi:hypothetical protein